MHLGSTKMIKKIALASTLLISTLVSAETPEKGFLLGLNLSKHDGEMEYKQFGTATNNHTVSSDAVSLVPKIGYQYYFTRIYFLTNQYSYKEARDRYSIKGSNYEIDVDYIPRIYKGKETSVHLLAGVSVGMQKSTLQNIRQEDQLLPVSPATPYYYTQKNFNHGGEPANKRRKK